MQAGKYVTYRFLCVGAMRISLLQGDKWGLRSPRARGWLNSGGSGLAGAPVEATWDEFVREPVPAGCRRFASGARPIEPMKRHCHRRPGWEQRGRC
jgi:hypothetical protein